MIPTLQFQCKNVRTYSFKLEKYAMAEKNRKYFY